MDTRDDSPSDTSAPPAPHRRDTFVDPTVPAPPFDAVPGEPLPPADFGHARDSVLGRGLWIGVIGMVLLLLALFAEGSVGAATAATSHHDDRFFPPAARLDDTLAQARKANKRGVVVLYEMNGCSECARLRATTFKDAGLRHTYQRDFVPVSVMADEPGPLRDFSGKATTQAEFAHAERVSVLPTVVFYDLDGLPVARQAGSALPLADWLRLARYVREAGYEEAPFAAWKPPVRKGG